LRSSRAVPASEQNTHSRKPRCMASLRRSAKRSKTNSRPNEIGNMEDDLKRACEYPTACASGPFYQSERGIEESKEEEQLILAPHSALWPGGSCCLTQLFG
jgi:hypothetical protein